jgi:hypothetical protein
MWIVVVAVPGLTLTVVVVGLPSYIHLWYKDVTRT